MPRPTSLYWRVADKVSAPSIQQAMNHDKEVIFMTPELLGTAACEPIKTATPQYLTAEQVGELLQVSPRTVQRWALEDASMPATRLGRTVRFPRAELERWIERSTQGSRKSKAVSGK